MASLCEILGLVGGGVVSIVGAGGKTTLMFTLAREIAAAGETVLTTTTTKILMPSRELSPQVIVSPHPDGILEKARSLPGGLRHATAGSDLMLPENKLAGFTADDITKIDEAGLFRWILVEADGAKHRPLKAPAAHEPVIPARSRWVIAVIGLDAPGQPLTEEWVFRSRFYGKLTGLTPGDRITERSIASALSHEEGIMKGSPRTASRLVFLNKADTESRREAGRRITGFLREVNGMRPDRVIITSLREGTESPEWYDLAEGTDLLNRGGTPSKSR
jgi:probable selenium-dependent hydroxylase accessory protein YqeC